MKSLEPHASRTLPSLSEHDAGLILALERARLAAVDVARFQGYMTEQLAAAVEAQLYEVHDLVVALRATSIIGTGSRVPDTSSPRESKLRALNAAS